MQSPENKLKETPRTNADTLPRALCEQGMFCNWKYELDKDGRLTKIPYNPRTGGRAQSNNAGTFSDLETAQRRQDKIPGIGLGIFGRIGVIDIDHSIDENGKPSALCSDIVARMDSYTELSPSGTGVHILFLLPDGYEYGEEYYTKSPDLPIEIYTPGNTFRFMTLTGNPYGPARDLEERGDQLRGVMDEYMKRPEKKKKATQTPPAKLDLSDSELLERIRNSENATLFNSLFAGDWEALGYESQSNADAALMSILAFWTQCDADQMERLFSQSGLANRDKWTDRPDYRQRTITAAINNCDTVRDPNYNKPAITDADREGWAIMRARCEATDGAQDDETGAAGNLSAETSKTAVRANNGVVGGTDETGAESQDTAGGNSQDTNGKESQDTDPTNFIPYRVGDYITGGQFEKDIDYFRKYKDRKTGFENLDKYFTLYPGLCVLGGGSSIGKTTFVYQMCDQLVQRGETVLYFSLEQSTQELVSKSLARRLIEKDPATHLTNTDVRDGATSETLEAVKREYAADVGDRLVICRCDFTVTAGEIRRYIEKYIAKTGRTPVVIIDYLQLISPPENFRGDIRAALDQNLKTLKAAQVANELFLIAISSLNRSSYETPASYEDFKESGLVEYSADYLMELQFSIMETDSFYRVPTSTNAAKTRETTKQERADMIYKETIANPRQVELVNLKNRNGKQKFKTFYRYYTDYDMFQPADARAYMDRDPDDVGGSVGPAGDDLPFD